MESSGENGSILLHILLSLLPPLLFWSLRAPNPKTVLQIHDAGKESYKNPRKQHYAVYRDEA